MRILYLTSCMEIGGTELYTLDYAKCMQNCGHKVYWGSVKEGKMHEIAKNNGINLLHCTFEKRTPVKMLKAINTIKRIVKNESIDLIHATDAYTAMLAALAFKRKNIKPKIVWSNVGIGSKTYAIMLKLCGNSFDTIIAVSHFIRNRMIEEGFDPNKIQVYSQSRKMLDSDIGRAAVRKEFGLSKDDVVIGTVGRVVRLKGNMTLVEAMPKILRTCPYAKLMIVGDGPQRKELEEKCDTLGIRDNVVFAGFRTDIENMYEAFDIVAFPTYYEALGYIPYEAFYYRKPLIASLTGGIPELVINEYNGLVVPPAMVDEWANGILRLINDTALSCKLADNGKKYYDTYLKRDDESAILEKLYFKLFSEDI